LAFKFWSLVKETREVLGLVLCLGVVMVGCGVMDVVLQGSGVMFGRGCMRELHFGLRGGMVAEAGSCRHVRSEDFVVSAAGDIMVLSAATFSPLGGCLVINSFSPSTLSNDKRRELS